MGNRLDCCYNMRWSYQCIFPCIRFCTYTGRRVWYNFDGMEQVQPLVHLYHPENRTINSFPEEFYGIHDHEDIKKQLATGLDAPGQLAALYKYASDNDYTIRAVGTGSSWSRLTHTKDILLDMTSLKEFITPAPWSRLDNKGKENVDIEVQAGMRVIDFVEKLDTDYGLALDMMGNYAGQTVAGVANTSTHGSGLFSGTMSTLVVGLHLIISGGVQVKVKGGDETFEACKEKLDNAKYGDGPVEINNDDVLKACAVGLGCMGIVYSITYRCVPMYNLEEIRKVEHVTWLSSEDFKVPPKFAEMYNDREEGQYFSFFVNPYPMKRGNNIEIDMAYLKAKRTDREPQCPACCACWCGPGGRGIAEIDCLQSDCTASCLQGCAKCCPSCIPRITNFGLWQFSLRTPYVQTWYNVLQFTKGNIHVRTAEWCLPLNDLDEALAMVIQLAQDYASKHRQYSLLPIYVRLVKADDLFMSPASKFRPDGSISEKNCYIEVPFLPGAFGIDEFQDVVENSLFKKFKARPHWGKNNQLNQVKVEQCYNNDKLNKWKQVFQLFNKGGLLNNRFTHNVGFDSFLIDQQPTV
ncbi:PREDICTED: L-gulonolactone oxidase-like [Acropora digitifera]|uniref:L-gulonolactone oxidase-like n=1 Tax=Acropora digitifera TaxID=70779 RepID=UPI00077ABEE2|nr:PREDICTED: L-gulonolactone oxidase-like [Acropora digitifera]